jgi:hypothetical protein
LIEEAISTDGTHLDYISFYLESHRLHTKHVFIYATKKGTEKKIERTHKKKRKRTITGRRFMRGNRYACRYNGKVSSRNARVSCQNTSYSDRKCTNDAAQLIERMKLSSRCIAGDDEFCAAVTVPF